MTVIFLDTELETQRGGEFPRDADSFLTKREVQLRAEGSGRSRVGELYVPWA